MSAIRITAVLTALILSILTASDAHAQLGARDQTDSGWAPISLGARVGYDNRQRQEMIGAQLRIPVLPNGTIELMPNLDVTFLDNGVKSYQYNFEAVYVLDGRRGGFYGGGGVVLLNSLFGNPATRSTEQGFSLVLGIRLVGLAFLVPQIEYRRTWADALAVPLDQLSLGLNLPLWNPTPDG